MQNYKYQKYLDEYHNYTHKNRLGETYLNVGEKILECKYYQVLFYKSTKELCIDPINERIFLVIPSIFNTPEILFLSRNKTFMDNLREYGNVFLIDWQEINEPHFSLNHYVQKVVEVLEILTPRIKGKIDFIGHCIGGNLAIATAIIAKNYLRTLTLLTTPWDFSHLSFFSQMQKYLNLDKPVRYSPIIPKIYIQIMFFLLFPNHFGNKVDKFMTINSMQEKELVFKIEHWLMSGKNLPSSTYFQIMDDILPNNVFKNLNWIIEGVVINPAAIDKPVYQVIASNDQIAPKASILPMQRLFKNSTIFETDGGHISYLINNKIGDLLKEYEKGDV